MDPVVRVTGGLVRGSSRDGVDAFLGIPYAAPAVGADRYRAPQPVVPWDGERDGDRVTDRPRPSRPTRRRWTRCCPARCRPGDDYLNVNVWAPADGDGLPVMVWIHGGAFVRGANS